MVACLLGATAARSFRFLTELLTGFVNLINRYQVWGRSLERPQFVYLFGLKGLIHGTEQECKDLERGMGSYCRAPYFCWL